MTFGENTLKNLADKGIIVKWYVEDTFAEYYNKLYLQAYEDYFEYYRNAYNVFVSKENPQDVECARKSAQSSAKWKSRPYEHTKLYITYGEQGRTFTRTTGKSQLITEEQVEKWIASNNKAYDTIYGSFADNTQQLLRGSKIRHYGFIYPTTYGIGIWVFFNRDADKCKLWVENLLKSKNLDYYTEYSDARFVFRYKISKAKANIAKMNG